MDEVQKFVKDVGVVAIAQLLIRLSPLILLPVLTRTLPIEDYGVWVQATVTIALATALAPLNLPYTLVRFLAGEKDRKELQEGFFSTAVEIGRAHV